MRRAERLLDELLWELVARTKSVAWVEDQYNIDAKDILRAWVKRARAEQQ